MGAAENSSIDRFELMTLKRLKSERRRNEMNAKGFVASASAAFNELAEEEKTFITFYLKLFVCFSMLLFNVVGRVN